MVYVGEVFVMCRYSRCKGSVYWNYFVEGSVQGGW